MAPVKQSVIAPPAAASSAMVRTCVPYTPGRAWLIFTCCDLLLRGLRTPACPVGHYSVYNNGTNCTGNVRIRKESMLECMMLNLERGTLAVSESVGAPPACQINQYAVFGKPCTNCPANSYTNYLGASTCICKAGYEARGTGAELFCASTLRALDLTLCLGNLS